MSVDTTTALPYNVAQDIRRIISAEVIAATTELIKRQQDMPGATKMPFEAMRALNFEYSEMRQLSMKLMEKYGIERNFTATPSTFIPEG